MLRNIVAILLGILVAGLGVAAVDALGHHLFPSSDDLDLSNTEALATALAALPLPALLFVPLAWFLGTTAGTAVAANLSSSDRLRNGLIVGVVMLAGGVATLMTLPYPTWLSALGVLAFFPATWIGSRLTAL